MSNKKSTRHACYYHNHLRNDGPPLFYFEQLKKIFGKENVTHLIPGAPDVDKWGPYDYHWWVDYGEDSFIGREESLKMTIPKDGGKTIYVVSDAHLDDGYRYEKAKQFDYVFFNQKHYINLYTGKNSSQQVYYLPHAAEPTAYPHTEAIKKYDICFIGHMQEFHKGNGIDMTRVDFLDAMFKKFPNFYFGTRNSMFPDKNMFEDAARHFCESKVVLNISVGNDVNMRFFETMMTGSFLLTNKIPELENLEKYRLFEDQHYVTYSTLNEAEEKVKYYLEHDEEREEIAKNAYNRAIKNGTYESRIKEICDKVGIEYK